MDRTIDVRTPESIAFSYELAGLGSRFLALALDQLIQIAVLLALFAGFALALSHVPPQTRLHMLTSSRVNVVKSIALAIVIIVVFMVLFGYFIIFETLSNGQTPGKRVLGIRVVRDGGYPLDFGASLVRNLIRVGEAMVGYYALSAISMLLSRENKRLGDLAAGTIVVRDARLATPNFEARAEEPVYSPTAYLSGEERALIKRFLERRDGLSRERREALAWQLAYRVRNRLPADLARLDDESLLERL
ncbi:MAG: RDD family protein [Candidatus Eremiobacteraeota bacterium]|nr:RDD family protein [Candidatus Eremiobacteraeota bacterium]